MANRSPQAGIHNVIIYGSKGISKAKRGPIGIFSGQFSLLQKYLIGCCSGQRKRELVVNHRHCTRKAEREPADDRKRHLSVELQVVLGKIIKVISSIQRSVYGSPCLRQIKDYRHTLPDRPIGGFVQDCFGIVRGILIIQLISKSKLP